MVFALLMLIVMILLFGAGVVRGWLTNLFGLVLGFILLAALIVFAVKIFGADDFHWLLLGGGGLLLALTILAKSASSSPFERSGVNSSKGKSAVEQSTDQTAARDLVWSWYTEDLNGSFDSEAREEAERLYEANDVQGLDRFCRRHSTTDVSY